MINMIVAIFERLKKLDDGTSSSSAVHMNTPNATPSLDVNIRHMATESTESKNGKNTVINEDPTVSSGKREKKM